MSEPNSNDAVIARILTLIKQSMPEFHKQLLVPCQGCGHNIYEHFRYCPDCGAHNPFFSRDEFMLEFRHSPDEKCTNELHLELSELIVPGLPMHYFCFCCGTQLIS